MATPKIVLLSISSRRISKRPTCDNSAPVSCAVYLRQRRSVVAIPARVACLAVARGHKPAFANRLRRGSLHSRRERRLVRAVGLEPTRRCHRGILSRLLCLILFL